MPDSVIERFVVL